MADNPTCILPGCSNRVFEQGLPCNSCVEDFGSYLRAGDGPPMSADAQAARDRDTHLSYALQLADGEPERITTDYALTPAGVGKVVEPPVRKANQRCWLCEQRRTCTKQERG